MYTPYSAKDAKNAADNYYLPLTLIFNYIRENAQNGLYTVVVAGASLNSAQVDILTKYGYTVDVVVDEKDAVKYNVSWSGEEALPSA
jgi:hypothetical protein